MTESLPPHKPVRDPGDAWVQSPTGEKYWGRFGAAGLLAVDADRGILMQHRALWSHHGGTWGIPGGAINEGEGAIAGALREANEEAGVPADAVRPFATTVLDRSVWTYTTVLAQTLRSFTPVAGDAESLDLAWVPVDAVADLDLHPAFGAAWPDLRALLTHHPVVVVDAANVVGAVPDGWWRDRRGAAQRLLQKLDALAAQGLPAESLDLPGNTWFPHVHVILEGAARGARGGGQVTVTDADGAGDDAIVAVAADRAKDGQAVTVVTSDRGLVARVRKGGADVRGARWLWRLLDG